MPTSDLEQENARLERELRIQQQISFASGLFQGDITIRTLLESLAKGVVIIDIQGTILLVNTLAEEMFGYPKKDFIGKPLAVLFPERFREIYEEHMARFLAEPMSKPNGKLLDLVGRRQDGSEFPVEISLGFIETINGIFVLAFISDITLRKQLETEIQDAREYAENIVETVREPLVVLNSDLKILTANHSFYDTFKVTPEETIGNFIYDLGNRQWDIPKLRVLFEEILPMIPCSMAMKSSMIFSISAARSFCSTPGRFSGKISAHTLSSWPWKTSPNASSWKRKSRMPGNMPRTLWKPCASRWWCWIPT